MTRVELIAGAAALCIASFAGGAAWQASRPQPVAEAPSAPPAALWRLVAENTACGRLADALKGD